MSTSLTFNETQKINKVTGYAFSGETEQINRDGRDIIVAKMIVLRQEAATKSTVRQMFSQVAPATRPTPSTTGAKVNQSYIRWTMSDVEDNLRKMESAGNKFADSIPALNLAKAAIERRKTGLNAHVGRTGASVRAFAQ